MVRLKRLLHVLRRWLRVNVCKENMIMYCRMKPTRSNYEQLMLTVKRCEKLGYRVRLDVDFIE